MRGSGQGEEKARKGIEVRRSKKCKRRIYLRNVSCFEEFRFTEGTLHVIVFLLDGSNIWVRETFDEINAACRAWEVAHVEG